jgi:hypothetical protein
MKYTYINHHICYSVTATDADWSEEFGSVYYWITDGNSEGHFFINELNGSLYLASPLDFEIEQSYSLTVSVRYNGSEYSEPCVMQTL